MKKWLMIVCAGLLAVLSACSSGSADNTNAEGKVELDFWTFWGSETRRPMIEKLIEDFNNSQDEIVVKHTYVPWGDIWTKNLAAIAAGDPPDVIVNDIRTVKIRASNNQVEDLSEWVDDDLKDSFYPHLWDAVTYNDKAYALPFTTDTRMLFYNKDAFREAGLDPDKPPRTWEELKEYSDKLTVKNDDGGYEQVGYYPNWGNFTTHDWMINADNGKGLMEGGKPTINTPAKKEAIQWMYDWKQELGAEAVQNMKAEFGNEQQDPFISGKVAMWAEIGTFYKQLQEFGGDLDYGVATMPAYNENTEPWSTGGGFVMEIPKGAKNPEASMKFIKYLTDVEAQTYWGENNFDNIANKKATEQITENLDGKGEEIFHKSMESLEHTYLSITPPEYPEYENLVNPLIDDALNGKISVEEALDQAQKDVENSKQ
ncbi:ABC transporter substrate-binding protein [Sediminibacillus terrae]|uniref:ABC transporter substrate-binding protein n=1 Tax=Sediminibacillus terrae TaxID=1562106 RepID=UPI001298148F|nr:ABC transporter substrate-binding protein [Sediminibacillus terrae]